MIAEMNVYGKVIIELCQEMRPKKTPVLPAVFLRANSIAEEDLLKNA